MLEDIFGNLQKQQEELQQKLSGFTVDADAGNGAVKVTAGADLRIKSLKIDPSKLDLSDAEQVEDLVIVALNEALEAAQALAARESQKLIEGMMPPGFPGMDQLLKH
jgi:nucleoid-associated protein EbfC